MHTERSKLTKQVKTLEMYGERVDNLLGKTKFSAMPCFLPGWIIESKIVVVQSATATIFLPGVYTSQIWLLSKLPASMMSYVPSGCHRQLISHHKEFMPLPDFQSHSCHDHLTKMAVVQIYSDDFDAISYETFALLSLLDLTETFDMVDHIIQLRRFKTELSFCVMPLQWMHSPRHRQG